MDLSGKAALVTGSTRGIGRAIAEALAGAGASVALNGRTMGDVEAAATAVQRTARGTITGIAADVGNPDECARLVRDAAARLGRLDVLVNNAGFGVLKSIEELTWDEWRGQIDVNLGGVWACTKAALPFLKEAARGDGAWVINIGSLASRNTFAGGTGYNASKFGLLGMTEATMLDLRPQGIRVSIVMPGSVNTDFGGRPAGAERDWRLQPADCALAVMQLLCYPKEAHVSRIELRPAMPDTGQSRR